MATDNRKPMTSSAKPGPKVLEGVPKVGYAFSSFTKCTTFGAVLESVMNYLGVHVDYEYILFTSGALSTRLGRTAGFPGTQIS